MYEEKVIEIEKLFLDPKNYRIDFERYNTTEKAVERLYLDEDIMGMIKGLVNFPGLHPHEKMIVVPKDKGEYKVLEGNRRLLAIKSLLGMIEPPAKHKREIIGLASKLSDETKESLRHIGTVVYEVGDKGYLKILADKHSSISYQRWGQISQWHFFKDLYDLNHRDIDLTANDLGKSKSDVSNYIRYYNLFSYIRTLPYWDENNLRDQIESNTLKATKFTRSLGFTDVKNALNLNYDEYFEVKLPEENLERFNLILCKYAEAALILDKSDDDLIYTRSNAEQVVELIDEWKKEFDQSKETETKDKVDTDPQDKGPDTPKEKTVTKESEDKIGKSTGTKPKGTTHKNPVKYFEDLKCSIENQRLKRLTTELRELSQKNRTDKFAASASMITRGLLESCLRYQVEKKGKIGDYKKSLEYEKDGKIFVSQEGIKNLVTFVLKNVEDIF